MSLSSQSTTKLNSLDSLCSEISNQADMLDNYSGDGSPSVDLGILTKFTEVNGVLFYDNQEVVLDDPNFDPVTTFEAALSN